ncbi:MAG: BON domain-containing protein [Holophagales bacterium]|nr:BON domain-containing protein [Holophagales bacterium]MBK9964086.1 BON domain-containing protein [Holophagales bacterium]
MKNPRIGLLVPGLLAAASLAMAAGCASSMVPKETRTADSAITSSIQDSLQNSEKVKARQVEVQTREGVVHLTGVVDTEEARREAARISWRTNDVGGVVNDLTVGERTVGSWTDDVLISSQVKSKLIAASGIKAGDIDVSSSQSVVTLIGRVSSSTIKSEAERIARGTKGVKDVNNELTVGMKK